MDYFNISWHSTKDGPGCRTVLFLQGCNLRCEWCHSPHSHSAKSPVLFLGEYCQQCGACVKVCPLKCHSIIGSKHYICHENCTNCGLCVKACHNEALKMYCFQSSPEKLFEKLKSELHLLRGVGGLTISGGEPMLQLQDVKQLLLLCRENGIHTAVETSAGVKTECFREIESYVDCWLFGLKQTNLDLCKKMTGADFHTVIENLHFLARHFPENIIVRTPLIYPCTSNLENINEICKLMKENKVRTIELLKYNPYTSLYYNALGKPFYEQGYRAVYDSEWNEILDLFQKNNINATYLT